ncbi:helix-turn-helix domain-containing protein [Roseburia sp. 1XD42-34]|nr:helix-turn-helix domain-containing protein [Roseburia sp. 1XD42-34]RKI79002.1 helix-turn-helix domain-containing protein [Clostridium sp. 1xD42-85]
MSNPYKFYSSQFKYEVLKAYKNEDYTLKELCSRYRIADVND